MGKKLKISIVRGLNRENLAPGKEQNLKGNVFLPVRWFENQGFKFSSDSGKKKIVRGQLNITPRSKISEKYDLGRKERVIVTMQGNHSPDDALFNEDVNLPNHLVDKKTKGNKGVLSG